MPTVFFGKARGKVANLNGNMSILQRGGMENCNPSLTREQWCQQHKTIYNGKLHLKSVPTNPNYSGFPDLSFIK